MDFYHYPGCSTCRKALKWLEARGIEVTRVHIVEQPPDAGRLAELQRRSGVELRRFFNTSGQSYRAGGFKERLGAMSDDEQLAALASDGKLIKRPLLDTGERVLVGFSEVEYEAVFAG